MDDPIASVKAEEPIIEIPIVKRGETTMQVRLKRNTVGLFVSVKVHPGVEEFARALGSGDIQDVRALGRYWTPVGVRPSSNPAECPLGTYNMTNNPGLINAGSGVMFRLDRPGQPLSEPSGVPTTTRSRNGDNDIPVINLSFLRLQGVSEGAGVNFHVKGVYTMDAVKSLAEQIKDACRAFYAMYLKPIDLAVVVSTQELQG